MRRCANCKFRVEMEGSPVHCRAVPPSAHNGLSSSFPIVVDGWRCGLHTYSVRRILRLMFKPRASNVPNQAS